MASCSLTSKATICWASLSEAARAAASTSSTAWSVAVTVSGFVRVEVVLGDVLDDAVGHEVPDRLARRLRSRQSVDEMASAGISTIVTRSAGMAASVAASIS